MAKKYDVIIVGAGPAGLLAAKAAGENGLEVALLEKKTDIAKIERTCAQTLGSMTESYLGNLKVLNSRDKRISHFPDGFSLKYDGPHRNLWAINTYAPNGHLVRQSVPEEARKMGVTSPSIVFDKEVLFRCLLEEVKAVSVDVFPGINVNKVTATPDGVTVEGSGKSFEGTYCIAADGVNSRIAQMMGFNENRYYWCNLNIISFYMSGVDAPDPNAIAISTGFFKEGAALFFMAPRPYEGEYSIQFLSIDPRVNLQKAADYFLNEAFTALWFKNAKKLRTFSAVCSCYDPIEDPFKDNVLVIADAAATQEIENEGAMICGWKAGQAISAAVREENWGLKERGLGLKVPGISWYVNWWQEAFVKGYDHEAYMKNWVIGLVLKEPEKMNYVFGLIKEPIPDISTNPYTGGKIMGRRLGQLAPIIEKERPDISSSWSELRRPLKGTYAEITRISRPVID